ncbi:hypothetical protein GCM10011611_43640 [Aliidongia dinghuensis]|uniref:Uncharacterized protein n=1 Tax=Aliidongia dinghuensis TaxID=1867774 RepID=A0A8J3E5I4_9PROT|nr:hypothetical protein [Aliidongia dinghuensis]GGF32728.1 hypothetical protein GCM10011611_43640 [Aliidongia dinghuensis]
MGDDLRQADLSSLTINQMTKEQRAELRRRFEEFVSAFTKHNPNARITAAPKVRKWVPGMKK